MLVVKAYRHRFGQDQKQQNNMVGTCFKNEWKQNPKEGFENGSKSEIPMRKTTTNGDRRRGKMSHRRKDEHGKQLLRSFGKTEMETWLLDDP
jgi:hypothetical protein